MPSKPADERNKPKFPPITNQTTLLSFDVESNGLHGPEFAVGAVVMSATGQVLDEFKARCHIRGRVDSWVAENVLPVLKDFPINFSSRRQLRQAFWQWFQSAIARADYVLVSNGYPVEMRFLAACQDDDLTKRYWEHPFPLLELHSLLLQIGEDQKHHVVTDKVKGTPNLKHNPYWDAWVSALAAFEAFRIAGRLTDK